MDNDLPNLGSAGRNTMDVSRAKNRATEVLAALDEDWGKEDRHSSAWWVGRLEQTLKYVIEDLSAGDL